jgi:hypothetical protein
MALFAIGLLVSASVAMAARATVIGIMDGDTIKILSDQRQDCTQEWNRLLSRDGR